MRFWHSTILRPRSLARPWYYLCWCQFPSRPNRFLKYRIRRVPRKFRFERSSACFEMDSTEYWSIRWRSKEVCAAYLFCLLYLLKFTTVMICKQMNLNIVVWQCLERAQEERVPLISWCHHLHEVILNAIRWFGLYWTFINLEFFLFSLQKFRTIFKGDCTIWNEFGRMVSASSWRCCSTTCYTIGWNVQMPHTKRLVKIHELSASGASWKYYRRILRLLCKW